MSAPPVAFTCQQISKAYQSRSGAVHALDRVSFNVREGEFVCVVGPSGCGKSTLLKILAGLLQPTSGRLRFGKEEGAASDRPRNALVFQEHGLFPWITVLDNVAFGLEMQGVRRPVRRRQARDFLDQVGLAAFADNYPHELSVGMRQRAAIARATGVPCRRRSGSGRRWRLNTWPRVHPWRNCWPASGLRY